jgi:hypothetical protein
MSNTGFGRGHGHAAGGIADKSLHRAEFDFVTQRRGCAVRIDIVNVPSRNARAADRSIHAPQRPISIWCRRSDVVSIT